MKALIIEDELRARKHMITLLEQNFPQVEVVGAVGSVKESIQWLSTNEAPDVIFMDVELSDGRSFEIFTQIELPCPVIMTTAYDQYAVQAFEVNAVDYLLKPIGLPELRRAISRVENGQAAKPAAETVRRMLDQVRKEKFLIRMNNRIVPVRTSDIAYFYSEAKNSYLVTFEGKSFVLDDSLDAIEGRIDPSLFFRISRSCIINGQAIESMGKLIGGRFRIVLKKGIEASTDLTVSRARADAFIGWMER